MNSLNECLYRCQASIKNETQPNSDPSDTVIDPETYTITKVCFSLSLLATAAHLILICCFSRIRLLYGYNILLGIVFCFFAYLFMLLTCSLSPGAPGSMHYIFSSSTDFCFLATIAANLVCCFDACWEQWPRGARCPIRLHHRLSGTAGQLQDLERSTGQTTIAWSTGLCNHRGRPFYSLVRILVTIGVPLAVVLTNIYLFDHATPAGLSHAKLANVTCNLVPSHEHLTVFFTAMALLLFGQVVCIGTASYLNLHKKVALSRPILPDELDLNARFWIACKLAITHCMVWLTAFCALFLSSLPAWHVFTLLCSLQAIYITVNSIFSRPILDIVHQWCDDKWAPENLKSELSLGAGLQTTAIGRVVGRRSNPSVLGSINNNNNNNNNSSSGRIVQK